MSVRILIGDCRKRMKELPDASVDSVVCDPPYELNFMNRAWDNTGIANDNTMWAEVLRVLKPGGHLVAFSGTRTYHRMVCAIEDAGFEIRDQLAYCYGSGFPKSLNVSKAARETICRCPARNHQLRAVREAEDDASGLAPQGEASDLLAEMQRHSSQSASGEVLGQHEGPEAGASIRSGQSGVEGRRLPEAGSRQLSGREVSESAGMGAADGSEGRLHHAASASDGADVRVSAHANGSGEPQRPQSGEQSPVEPGVVADERGSQTWRGWPVCGGCGKPIIPEGLGSALKPAWEPICLARKPLAGTVAQCVLAHGTGALNIDGCRIEGEVPQTTQGASSRIYGGGKGLAPEGQQTSNPSPLGRFPANLCHDGSDEVVAGFPETHARGNVTPTKRGTAIFGSCDASEGEIDGGDSGSAARFFYCAKSSSDERGEGNTHPTVKPIALMRWLVRLVTPPGGTVLDPFMGSGSTLIAADAEQFNAIGCEMSPEYAAIAEKRIRDAAGMFADVKVAA